MRSRLRRATLTAAALAVGAAASALSPALRSGDGPGTLVIGNPHLQALTIDRRLAVERQDGFRWLAVPADVRAVASCNGPAGTFTIVPPHALLTIPRWSGLSCDGQCPSSCRHNVYMGAGPFRFVVTTLPSGIRTAGPSFRLPNQPPD